MSADLIAEIAADLDRMLADCDRLYRAIETQSGPEGAGDGPDPRLVRVTELIEVLESVTYDRVRRLQP